MVVTHPFHPLSGERLEVEGQERPNGGWRLRCRGPLGTVVVPVEWTDRSAPGSQSRLTYEGLVDVAGIVTAIRAG